MDPREQPDLRLKEHRGIRGRKGPRLFQVSTEKAKTIDWGNGRGRKWIDVLTDTGRKYVFKG